MTDVLLTWLCSYLLHSSLLIGGLWAAERAGLLGRLATATQEALWRLALLGGLVSASVPLLPALPSVAPPAEAPRPALVARVADVPPADLPAIVVDTPPAAARPSAQLAGLPLAARITPKAQDAAVGFVAVWLLGAVLASAGLALQWLWLRRAVRRLPELADTRWQHLAARLCAELGLPRPALRHARAGWASPLLAPGRVLCLPAWCLDLPDDEAHAVLGHELAHLRRRDPAWRLLAAMVKALLWPQPLNRLALQRLDLLAELACDAAATATAPAGQRLALAQSLLRCAEALKAQGGRRAPALACGAASAGSPLFARIRRLLRPEGEAATPREHRGLRWGLVVAMLATLVALPAVVVSHTDGRELLERFDLADITHGLTISTRGTRIYSRYPGGSFAVTLDGKADFNDAEDDLQTLTGTLTVKEREGGLTREMVLTSMGEGRIERSYRVGGESQPLDAAGRLWWGLAVQRMAEQLTDPVVRAKKLFARGGFDAVLADIDKPGDDFARRRRIDAALGLATPLTPAVQDRLIAASATLKGGFERREALGAIARQPLAEAQQLAWLKAAGGIDGDFERREALGALASRLITTPPVLAAALQAASRLQGDFEKREALAAIARRLQGDEAEIVEAYARVATSIGGGFERREALNQLLERPRLGPAGLERVLASAEAMEGGFERLQVLLRVAEKMGQAKPVDAALIERVRRAGRGLGEHERGQIENALDRLG